MTRNNKQGIAGFPKSLKFAIQGYFSAILCERNMRIHTVATILVLSFAYILKLPAVDIVVLIVTCTVVISAELLNTSLEVVCDMLTPEYSKQAALLKDTAASAVLFMGFGAIAVGVYIFFIKKRIHLLINFFKENIFILFIYIVFIIISLLFINGNIIKFRDDIRK